MRTAWVAGQAMPTRISTGTTVQMISAVVLWLNRWMSRLDRALGLAELEHRVAHRAEHDDADHHADPQDDHVQPGRPRSADSVTPRRHVELPAGFNRKHPSAPVDFPKSDLSEVLTGL
jgi:hypothetical protein